MKPMQQITQKNKLPDFSKMTREEEATWWETHSVSDYLDEFERVSVKFQLRETRNENIVVRVQKPIKDKLEKIARSQGLNISSLTRMWLLEKLKTV